MSVLRLLRLPLAAALVLVAASLAAGTAQAARTGAGSADRLLAPVTACPGSDQLGAAVPDQLAQMACLVNYARTRAGLPKLRESKTLDHAALLKLDLDIRCGAFTHTPCGQPFQQVFADAGWSLAGSYSLGENLAYGQDSLGSAQQIMQAWLDSPDHRANLLSRSYTTFGLAVRPATTFLGYQDIAIWANEFAGP